MESVFSCLRGEWGENGNVIYTVETPFKTIAADSIEYIENTLNGYFDVAQENKRLREALKEAVFMNERRPAAYKTIMPKAYIEAGNKDIDLHKRWEIHVNQALAESETE